jgi:predicted helicase
MNIIDTFYSNLDDDQLHKRINHLWVKENISSTENTVRDSIISQISLSVDRLKGLSIKKGATFQKSDSFSV